MKGRFDMNTVAKWFFPILLLTALPLMSQNYIDRLNSAAGIPLLKRTSVWNRADFETMLKQNRIRLEGDPARRTAFLANRMIFGTQAVEIRIISDSRDIVCQADIVYSNKGDFGKAKQWKKQIKKSAKSISSVLTSLLGPSKQGTFGPLGMQESVQVWNVGKTRLMLESAQKEYTILHICYQDPAPRKVSREDIRSRNDNLGGNVLSEESGDIVINNIPMVNQGSKGYCVPATVERVLTYYGIRQVSMHQLAKAAKTGRGGGTSFESMVNSIRQMCRKYDLGIITLGDLRMPTIDKYISKGIPVFWGMNLNPEFIRLMNLSRMNRPLSQSPEAWLDTVRKYRVPRNGEGHMCLIVGCNVRTSEIAISSSWGEREIIPAWIPLRLALKVSQGATFIIRPN